MDNREDIDNLFRDSLHDQDIPVDLKAMEQAMSMLDQNFVAKGKWASLKSISFIATLFSVSAIVATLFYFYTQDDSKLLTHADENVKNRLLDNQINTNQTINKIDSSINEVKSNQSLLIESKNENLNNGNQTLTKDEAEINKTEISPLINNSNQNVKTEKSAQQVRGENSLISSENNGNQNSSKESSSKTGKRLSDNKINSKENSNKSKEILDSKSNKKIDFKANSLANKVSKNKNDGKPQTKIELAETNKINSSKENRTVDNVNDTTNKIAENLQEDNLNKIDTSPAMKEFTSDEKNKEISNKINSKNKSEDAQEKNTSIQNQKAIDSDSQVSTQNKNDQPISNQETKNIEVTTTNDSDNKLNNKTFTESPTNSIPAVVSPKSIIDPAATAATKGKWDLRVTANLGYVSSSIKGSDETMKAYFDQRNKQELSAIGFGGDIMVNRNFKNSFLTSGITVLKAGEKIEYSRKENVTYSIDNSYFEDEFIYSYIYDSIGQVIIDSILVPSGDSIYIVNIDTITTEIENKAIAANNGTTSLIHIIIPIGYGYRIAHWSQSELFAAGSVEFDYLAVKKAYYLSPNRNELIAYKDFKSYQSFMINANIGLEYRRKWLNDNLYMMFNPGFRTNLFSWNKDFKHNYYIPYFRFGVGFKF
jgi:hypothetical protein